MLKLNTRYRLRNKNGDEKTITINNLQDQTFYSKYIDQDGYQFTELEEKSVEFKGDLPETTATTPAKPRIHMAPGESVCVSCEG